MRRRSAGASAAAQIAFPETVRATASPETGADVRRLAREHGVKYKAQIDGLRAVAVLPVILFHAGFTFFSGGYVGVDIFFVISGYLITTIILNDLAAGRFSVVNFYERRARRILPALFVVLLACLPFAWMWLDEEELKDFSQSLVAVSSFSSNILFWIKTDYFAPNAELWPLLHTWSLAVEEQYYLGIPLILWLAWRYARRAILPVFLIMVAVSFVAAATQVYDYPAATFYLLHARAWELLAGGILAWLAFGSKIDLSPTANQVLSLVGLALVLGSIFLFTERTPFPSAYAAIPVLGTVLIILSAQPGTLACRLLSNRAMVGIGLISYSAYLWHQPIFAFARHRLVRPPTPLEYACLAALSLALAWLSWKYIEVPFRDKSRIGRRGIFVFSLAGIVAFASLGMIGHLRDGFPERLQKIPHAAEFKQATVKNGWCFYSVDTIRSLPVGAEGVKCWLGVRRGDAGASGVLFGDSFAGQYEPFWDTVGKRAGLRLNAITTNWCYPAFSQEFTGPKGRDAYRQCLYDREYVKKHLAAYDFVVLGGHWAQIAEQGRLQDVIDAMDAIAASGKLVIVMPSPKLHDLNPLSAYKKSFMFGKPFSMETIGSQRDEQARAANLAVRNAAAKHANVVYIDRSDLFGVDGRSSDVDANGIPFALDTGHISIYGAKASAESFLRSDKYRQIVARLGKPQPDNR